MYTVLLVAQVIIVLGMIGIILIQRTSSDGLSGLGGGGGGNNFLSGRASANLLTRVTGILAALFMLNSLGLSVIIARSSDRGSVIDRYSVEEKVKEEAPAAQPVPAQEAPKVPAAE